MQWNLESGNWFRMPFPEDPKGISQREYARHRGVSHVAVGKAIKTNRLKDSVKNGKIIDIALADQEWTQHTDTTREPLTEDMSEAAARAKHWDAKLKELKFLEADGQLIAASEVEKTLTSVFAACKGRLLGVPSRLRQQDPTLTPEQIALVEALIRETLEGLARAG